MRAVIGFVIRVGHETAYYITSVGCLGIEISQEFLAALGEGIFTISGLATQLLLLPYLHDVERVTSSYLLGPISHIFVTEDPRVREVQALRLW